MIIVWEYPIAVKRKYFSKYFQIWVNNRIGLKYFPGNIFGLTCWEIEIVVKKPWSRREFVFRDRNCLQRSTFWSKIPFLVENRVFFMFREFELIFSGILLSVKKIKLDWLVSDFIKKNFIYFLEILKDFF